MSSQSTEQPLNDRVIQTLLIKKKDLLQQLLRQSIQTAIETPTVVFELEYRQEILDRLQQTDSAIATRKEQLGVDVQVAEGELQTEIRHTLEAIRENNAQALFRMEAQKKELEAEKADLDRGNKVSGYITQQKRYGAISRRINKPTNGRQNRVISGKL